MEELERNGWRSPEGDLLTAAALFNEGDSDGALARISESERRAPSNPALYGLIGQIHLGSGDRIDHGFG